MVVGIKQRVYGFKRVEHHVGLILWTPLDHTDEFIEVYLRVLQGLQPCLYGDTLTGRLCGGLSDSHPESRVGGLVERGGLPQ